MIELIWNGFLINFLLIISLNKLNNKVLKFNQNIFLLTIIFHLIITVAYIFVFYNEPADFKTYLSVDELKITNYGSFVSSDLVHNLIAFMKFRLFFNNINIILFFSLVSLVGILFFVKNLIKIGLRKEYAVIFLFIPDLHFWTSSPGKDSLLVFFLSFFFYLYIHNYRSYSVFLLLMVILIRPHIGIIFFSSLIITEFIFSNNYKKIFILISSFLFFFLFIKFEFTNYFFLESGTLSELPRSLNIIMTKYLDSGTGYENTNFVLNIINYIFFPFEFIFISNSFSINLSIMIQILTLLIIVNFIFIKKSKLKINNKLFTFLIFLNLIYFSILPQLLFNYGLNVRQKWMIIPFLIYLLLFFANLLLQRKKI